MEGIDRGGRWVLPRRAVCQGPRRCECLTQSWFVLVDCIARGIPQTHGQESGRGLHCFVSRPGQRELQSHRVWISMEGRMGHATRDGTSPRCRYVPACTRLLQRSSPHGNYSVLALKCYQTTRTFEPTAITRTSGKLPRLGRHRARMGLFKDSLEVLANPCRRRSRWARLGARSGRRDVDGLDQASQPAFFVLAKSPGSISCAS